MKSPKTVNTFFKAQIAALSGGITDYALMVLFTEIFHIYFVVSILISGFIGGLVIYSLDRFWAFKNHDGYTVSTNQQILRFFSVVIGSMSLKSGGTYLLHRSFKLDYRIGRLLIDSLVSYGFNYPLMKFWVFGFSWSEEPEQKTIS
jgi:putative flippase GtrA